MKGEQRREAEEERERERKEIDSRYHAYTPNAQAIYDYACA